MRVLIVGLGGAGTQIVDNMAQRHRPETLWGRVKAWFRSLFQPQSLDLAFLAADAPEAAPDEWEGLQDGEFVPIGDGAGSGGDIGSADRIWRRDGGKVRDAAGETDPWDLAVVVGAVGGGTAAACMGPMADTLRSLGKDAPVIAAPILPFEREADRAHRNAAPGLARLREQDPAGILLLANDRLGEPEGALSDVYGGTNQRIQHHLRTLLEGISGAGVRAVDRAELETTLSPGNGFAVLGHAEADPADEPEEVVEAALSPAACSAEADPAADASRVLLLVNGDPDDLALGALLDQAQAIVPDREVLLGARATEGSPLEVLSFLGLERARAAETVLDRYEDLQQDAEEAEDHGLDDHLQQVGDEPTGGIEPSPGPGAETPSSRREEPRGPSDPADEDDTEDDEPPEWVEDYRAAQQKAMDLDIKANQSHDDLIQAIREKEGEDDDAN